MAHLGRAQDVNETKPSCAFTWAGFCAIKIGSCLIFRINATEAKVNTKTLSEIVIEVKLRPIGDNPKNRPTSPSKPKLKATDNTNSSTKSSLFLLINRMFAKQ